MALSLVIGLVFGSIAAGMSFLITYEEYSGHQLLSRGEVLKQSLQTAAVTWVFFVALAFVLGVWLGAIVQGGQVSPPRSGA